MKVEFITTDYDCITIDLPVIPRLGEFIYLNEIQPDCFSDPAIYARYQTDHDWLTLYKVENVYWSIGIYPYVTIWLDED